MANFARLGYGLFALFVLRAIKSAMSIDPCPNTAQSLSITTTAEAMELATALNCSGGGSFDVLWEGTVIVDQTLALRDGIVVTITGVGSGAIVHGGGDTQLFTVTSSTLNLVDIALENGTAVGGDTSDRGGAVWAAGVDSVVVCSGSTTFKNNDASRGGAVSLEEGAVALWADSTSFIGNSATFTGGAVLLLTGSNVSWTGQTYFSANTASSGGALYSSTSVAIFSGETTFAENYASITAGAVYASHSKVSWNGVTSFENSETTVTTDGPGAVDTFRSVISWQGKMSFLGGFGGQSGAVAVSSSNVSWEGETFFCDNEATLHGGALAVTESSNVSWTGKTIFCNNRVLDDGSLTGGFGGALYVLDSVIAWNGTTTFDNNFAYSGGAVFADGVTHMALGGRSTFMGNAAMTNGGAVALGTEVTLDLETLGTNMSLTGNVAAVAGGAVYMSGTSVGVIWLGTTFTSNSALNGGAVYSVASGTAMDGNTDFVTEYYDCIFRNNTVVASGGAIESAAGKDNFINSIFEGNTAGGLGGGLRLAGTTSLQNCNFVGNGAKETGPAVANVGTVHVTKSSFYKNSLICDSGEFLNYTVEGTADDTANDYYNSVCDGCEECNGLCPVDQNGMQECIAALDNTISTGTDEESGEPITLETLRIEAGYWRPMNIPATILPCWNEDACSGGLTDAADYCNDGYRGPYCAICADAYAQTFAYTCSKCSDGEGIAFAVVVLLVVLTAIVAVIFHLVSNDHDERNTRFKRVTKALPVQGLKIVVVAWQILTQFDSVANVTYAGVYGEFLDGISSIISFDLGLVLSAGCMVTTNFHHRLLISTLGPLIALAALAVCFKVATRRNRGSEGALQLVRRKHFSMALLITFLVYSSVSATIFRLFACETLDDGKEYLLADYTIECTDANHKAFQVYGVFMILLYPIGIPLLYAMVLYKNHEAVKNRRHHLQVRSEGLEVTASLWQPYKPSRYYYEVVECARRVTLTGVVVFIYPNTAAQVAVTLVLAFVFVMVSESLAPYASRQDAWLSRVGHIVVFLSMFQALVLKVDVSDENSDSQEVFGGVLLAANICMVIAVITEAVLVVCSLCGRGDAALKEKAEPGVR